MDSSQPTNFGRVAIIHDWLTGMRGGERVLEHFLKLFPEADVFTLVCVPERISSTIAAHRIFESPIVRLPFGRSHFRSWLPLFPWAIESFELKGYQLILSSSHCVAKGVIPPPDALHISYVHSPMRYIWDMRSEYLGGPDTGWVKRGFAGFAAHYLRNWDAVSANRVDKFIANSGHVRERIRKYYRREAEVIYPPVEVGDFSVGDGKGGYFLAVSSMVPYKRLDLVIIACERLGLRLKIVGDGPEYPRLKALAGKYTEFIGAIPFKELGGLFQNAIAFIHAAEEDFGIAPLEAQASGRPVIAYGRGGVLETVSEGGTAPTGCFFREPTVDSLISALREFDAGRFDPADARKNAERFGPVRFQTEIMNSISRVVSRDTSR